VTEQDSPEAGPARPTAASPTTPHRPIDLPPFPAVATSLLALIRRGEAGLSEVAELVATDAAVSVDILRVANNAVYGTARPVTNLHEAVVRLGLERVAGLALAVCLRQFAGRAFKSLEVYACWRHSLACALTAEQVASAIGGQARDAYTFGLLHDVGRLALLAARPGEYVAVLRKMETCQHRDQLVCEREAMGTDHCEMGRVLLAHLHLDAAFQEVAAYHHQTPPDGTSPWVARIGIACQLADLFGFRAVHLPRLPEEPCATFERIVEPLGPILRQRLIERQQPLAETVTALVDAFSGLVL